MCLLKAARGAFLATLVLATQAISPQCCGEGHLYMYADADTPSKAIGEAFARAGSGASPAPAAPQGPAAPAEAEPGTYAATATPFEGGSHSILPPTPSISGEPPAAMGSAPDQAPAVSQASAALQSAQNEQQVQLQALLFACSLPYAEYHKSMTCGHQLSFCQPSSCRFYLHGSITSVCSIAGLITVISFAS